MGPVARGRVMGFIEKLPFRRRIEGESRARFRLTPSSGRHSAGGKLPLERRRARALVLGAAVFAVMVLVSAMPISALLTQHQQVAAATAQLRSLRAENRVLGHQARELSSPAAVAALARQDYGLVAPGQKAYDVIPPPGAPAPTAAGSGHVPLEQRPVVPGSLLSQQLLGAAASPSTTLPRPAVTLATTRGSNDASAPGGAPVDTARAHTSGGYWSRVAHTLEFWN